MEGGEEVWGRPEDTCCALPPAARNQQHLSQHVLVSLSHIPPKRRQTFAVSDVHGCSPIDLFLALKLLGLFLISLAYKHQLCVSQSPLNDKSLF